ncbi:16S rRNA (cytosine(1402)-N(4))-methyltransferase RsmH [Tundrisphaera sp. TA3]|uniref:16S rRNA (cytosine(1402)-N(4))-methyltransferase RsmH n=1 Tax=Tundrisphaera sp. TA3 TaxID=3435775 RepID=UPI003EBA2651
MSDPAPDKPARRPRYRGPNPRQFREKYKELRPDAHADDVARVVARGQTPAGTHRPIMVAEILAGLAPRPGEVAVDCTLGHAGHALALLEAVMPGGKLLGIDADPIELPRAEARLRASGVPDGAVVVARMNYAGLARFVAAEAPGGADVILADLGLSSMQIDDPARGFTFKADGPLDMRMNPEKGASAAALLSRLDTPGLARILSENADEPRASAIASAILAARPLTTTRALAGAVRSAFSRADGRPGGPADDAVRRAFQAIRIAVNDEFAGLETLLRVLPSCLKPGGRVAILSFHSGEDRRVKAAFKEGLQSGAYASISKEFLTASPEERRSNPRSSSAKLRFATRSGLGS